MSITAYKTLRSGQRILYNTAFVASKSFPPAVCRFTSQAACRSVRQESGITARNVTEEEARKIELSSLKVAKPYLAPNSANPKMLTLWPLMQRFPLLQRLIFGLVKVGGFNNSTTIAIRNTSNMFDILSKWAFDERAWVYDDALLPMTFQTWFSITNLHVWILTTRIRALPPNVSRLYEQELVNQFFTEAEKRIRGQFNITSDSQLKKYMRNFQQQWRGSSISYDYSLTQPQSDSLLASALWRNIWMEGVQADGIHKDSSLIGRSDTESEIDPLLVPIHIEKLVSHIRKEIQRLALLSDNDIMKGSIGHFRSISVGTDCLQ